MSLQGSVPFFMDTINSQDVPTKVRKPYTTTKQREKWTEDDHTKFLEALKLHGRAWRRIEDHIGTKTTIQIRSHAQKFFSKMERDTSFPGLLGRGSSREIQIPPPRPKRRPCHPYPKKALCETNQTTRNSSFEEAYSKTFPDIHSPIVDCEQIDSLRSHEEHLSHVSSPASNNTSCISDHSPQQEDATSSDTSSEKHVTSYRLETCEKDLDAAPTANIIGDPNENMGDNPTNDIAHEQGVPSISSFRPIFGMAHYSSLYIPVLLLPHTFSYSENDEAKVTAFAITTMARNMSAASTNWEASSRVLYNPKPILASLWKPQERKPKRNITNHQDNDAFDEEYEQLNAHRGDVENLDDLVDMSKSLDAHDVVAIKKQQYMHMEKYEKTRVRMTCHSIKGNTHGEKGFMHCGNGKLHHCEDYSTKMDSKNLSVKMTGKESEVYNQALETVKADHMPLCQISNDESQLSSIHTQVYYQTCQHDPSLEIDRNHKFAGRKYQSHGASNETTMFAHGPRNNETSSLTLSSKAAKCIFRATSYSGDGFIPYRRPC